MRWAVLVLAATLAACGGDREGVAVTEADPVGTLAPAAPPPRFDTPLDTTYADSALFADPALDSLAADSAEADTLRVAASGPDFRTFWPRFRAALADAPETLGTFAALREGSTPVDVLVADPLFRERVLSLTARDFRRQGTSRDVWVRVGFDRDGNVVPEDEAETESGLGLRFEVVDGAYRLVRLDAAG